MEDESEIDRLKDDLYKPDESENLVSRQEKLKRLGIRRKKLEPARATSGIKFKDTMQDSIRKRRKWLMIVAGGLAVILVGGGALAATIWWRNQQTVRDDQVILEIEAPVAITSGEVAEYNLLVRNASNVRWNRVEIVFTVPEGMEQIEAPEAEINGRQIVWKVDQLATGEELALQLAGRVVGRRNESIQVLTETTFTPENWPSGRFSSSTVASSTISSVPLEVSLDVPTEVKNGARVVATAKIVNTSLDDVRNLYVRLEPAPGWQLAIDDPEFTENFSVLDSLWAIENLPVGASLEFKAALFAAGAAGETRELSVEVGLLENGRRFEQQTVASATKLVAPTLLVEQVFNQKSDDLVVGVEDEVEAVIKLANTGDLALTDIVVATAFEGEGLNEEELELTAGGYDAVVRKITWTSSTVPDLELLSPGQEIEIRYSFEVKALDDFELDQERGANNALIVTTEVDSPDVTVAGADEETASLDRAVLSIRSPILLSGDAFYDDGRLGIESSGPLPPRVGEETTYTVRVRLGSGLNQLGEVRVVAQIPDGIRYTGEQVATKGEAKFDERSGEMVWLVPSVEALTGRASPYDELHFQVALNPAVNQRGQEVELLNELTGSGLDLFVDEEISEKVEVLPTTETAAPDQGKVE